MIAKRGTQTNTGSGTGALQLPDRISMEEPLAQEEPEKKEKHSDSNTLAYLLLAVRLPPRFPVEHFAKIHLPGAVNACVYQVTFLDDMKSLCADMDKVIVLYGSSKHSLDAVTAAEKLQRCGYRQVTV